MRVRYWLFSVACLCLPGFYLGTGCGDDGSAATDAAPPDAPTKDVVMAAWGHPCDDPLSSVYEAATPPSPWTAADRGTIVHCAYDRRVTPEEMSAHMNNPDYGFSDPGFSTAIHKVRLSYWTERNAGEPVLTSAVMYIPEQMRGAPTAPLVVLGHGSVGIGDACAPSKEDPNCFEKDWKALAYTFAGDGWLVVMPDFPGLGTPGVHAWTYSTDEGHSMLDATRAVRNLDGPVGTKNALVGHSQGGHAALSAQSYAADYGADGTIDTVLVMNPFWLSNAAWGALASAGGDSLINSTFMAMSLMYFYGHLAVYDGESHDGDAFVAAKRDAIVNMLEDNCWRQVTSDETGPPSLGLNLGSDAFTTQYAEEVGACGFLDNMCTTSLQLEWRARWAADRPPSDPNIPIVHWTGANDDFLTPGFQKCGIDRIDAQTTNVTYCVAPNSDHSQIVGNQAAWYRQYLASVLMGDTAPAACAGLDTLPQPLQCDLPIANLTDPGTP